MASRPASDLHAQFVKLVGTPKRTYVWGDSLGGLVTELLAETHPEWVDGAAPMCGVLAGPNLNFDVALDVAYAVKALIDPQLKLTGYTDQQDASANWQHASAAVQKAAADVAGGGTAKVMFIGSLVDAPTATQTYDGHDLPSQVKARVEALLTALAFGTSGRYELEQRVGGNPSRELRRRLPEPDRRRRGRPDRHGGRQRREAAAAAGSRAADHRRRHRPRGLRQARRTDR